MNENLKEFIEGYKEGQKDFGEYISVIINSILLTIVYFLGVGISFIFSKLFRKKFMDLSLDKNAKSYWSELGLTKKEKGEYFRQF